MSETVEPREPYRLLFPLGVLMAVAGVFPWILFYAGFLDVYPNVFHSRVMFHGFLMAFISGFLMTAIPRMSGTAPCRPFEAAAVVVLLTAQLFFGGDAALSATIFTMHASALLVYVARRIFHRSQNPPSIFLFVPVGLTTAVVGGLLLIFADRLPPSWGHLGKLLAFQAFVLNLIVGLGSRLVPVLSRAPGALSPTQAGGSGWLLHVPMVLLFNSSFVVEAFLDPRGGIALRALTLTWAAFDGLRLGAALQPVTALGVALRVATAFLFLPYYLLWLFPQGGMHWLHLVYVGGIGMMTMMVAVRVVLAHGGAGFAKEARSPGLIAAAGFLASATLIRALVPTMSPAESFGAFAAAASLWIVGLLCWVATLGRHLDRPWAVFRKDPS